MLRVHFEISSPRSSRQGEVVDQQCEYIKEAPARPDSFMLMGGNGDGVILKKDEVVRVETDTSGAGSWF